jgi:hypothetical protein
MDSPTDNPSLQPMAQQAPGNILAGRFGSFGRTASDNWKKVAVIAVVVLVVWYLYKKFGK